MARATGGRRAGRGRWRGARECTQEGGARVTAGGGGFGRGRCTGAAGSWARRRGVRAADGCPRLQRRQTGSAPGGRWRSCRVANGRGGSARTRTAGADGQLPCTPRAPARFTRLVRTEVQFPAQISTFAAIALRSRCAAPRTIASDLRFCGVVVSRTGGCALQRASAGPAAVGEVEIRARIRESMRRALPRARACDGGPAVTGAGRAGGSGGCAPGSFFRF